jgi:hypothetical protein
MTKESKCPRKIERLDKLHREILDKLLKDDGHLITPKHGLVLETHRPISCKQISFIYLTIFDVYISRQTLAKYLNYLEKKEEENA